MEISDEKEGERKGDPEGVEKALGEIYTIRYHHSSVFTNKRSFVTGINSEVIAAQVEYYFGHGATVDERILRSLLTDYFNDATKSQEMLYAINSRFRGFIISRSITKFWYDEARYIRFFRALISFFPDLCLRIRNYNRPTELSNRVNPVDF